MSGLNFSIDGVPVPKGRPRLTTINGMARAFTPKKTRDYEDDVRAAAIAAMSEDGLMLFDRPLCVKVDIYLPIPKSWSKKKHQDAMDGKVVPTKKPDIDNVCKCILDAMNKVVYVDDAQIVDFYAKKRYWFKPRVDVQVSVIAGESA